MAYNPLAPLVSYVNKRNTRANRMISCKEKASPMMTENNTMVYPLFLKEVESKIILNNTSDRKHYKHHPFFGICLYSDKYDPGSVILMHDIQGQHATVWHGTNVIITRQANIFGVIPKGLDYLNEIDDMLLW